MESPESAAGIFTPHSSESQQDIMNDAAYETNTHGQEKNSEDADTCRICRGEGSQDEPLFYPCKCSGSIKYVHQNCLMEWLSHSQKKHCELCKTPFRFTKLYDAHMPNTVPVPVFLRQATVHVWKTLLTWSRFLLVIFVWALWLPWCIRAVWRGLFWIGDGGWVDWKERGRQEGQATLNQLAENAGNNTTSAIWDGFLSEMDMSPAAITKASSRIYRMVGQAFRIFDDGPVTFRLVKKLYHGVFASSSTKETNLSSTTNVTNVPAPSLRPTSWLSDIPHMNSLTRWTTFNNIIVDTLEGAIITLCVVTAFILVFLIREWVMQQQQNLLLGPDVNELELMVNEREAQLRDPNGIPDNVGPIEPPQDVRPVARLLARPRRRLQRQATQAEDANLRPNDRQDSMAEEDELGDNPSEMQTRTDASVSDVQRESERNATRSPQRPAMPERDMIARAVKIRRTLEEQGRLVGDSSSFGKNEFADLLFRAGNMPSEVIKIIKEEGRTDELKWIIDIMERSQHSAAPVPQANPPASNTMSSEMVGADDLASRNPARQPDHDSPHSVIKPEGLDTSDEDFEILQGITESRSIGRQEDAENAKQPRRLLPEDWLDSIGASADKERRDSRLISQLDDKKPAENRSHQQHDRGQRLASADANPSPNWHFPDDNSNIQSSIHKRDNEVNGSAHHFSDEATNGTTEPNIHQADPTDQGVSDSADSPTVEGFETAASNVAPEQQSFINRLADWLWGNVALPVEPAEQQAGDDEHVVDDIADEAPFVPVVRAQQLLPGLNNAGNQPQDPEVAAAAAQAGIDPNEAEALDDIEDLEGVMELIGMQGPLAGLIQNGMFCAVLVSLTICFALWVPYISGKMFLSVLADPIRILVKSPLRLASSSADMIVDLCVFGTGCAFYWTDTLIGYVCAPVGWFIPPLAAISRNQVLARTAKGYAENALERLVEASFVTGGSISGGMDVPKFSAIAHEALYLLEARIIWSLQAIYSPLVICFESVQRTSGASESLTIMLESAKAILALLMERSLLLVSSIPRVSEVNPLRFNLGSQQRTTSIDYRLAAWNANDRTVAIISGYVLFALLGVIYLRIAAWLQNDSRRKRVEGGVADILYQAGGVMKVILIISIEMIVFPLYCGLLLDLALLPLFGHATFMSRLHFTLASPNTSMFVHWFAGTCYMFHFALFVSMCRKILRTGVLYFIRDPDDPTFHPVRDVLERSVSSQLWKISFSALVYGALVLLCLGGVVWGISFTLDGIFPIHWSSNEPVLEFPVDLLFYNFLMPVAVKFFRPAAGLKMMYSWWFRKCARLLRLSNFLFGEKCLEEEGRHVRYFWKDWILNNKSVVPLSMNEDTKPNVIKGDNKRNLEQEKNTKTDFIPDGGYVRAPASDQVRIPKGALTFLPVDENNDRKDGLPDKDDGLHGRKNEQFKMIYIPPFFRLRLAAFIFLIWVFAASTGVSITVIPLLFGRFVFAQLAPHHLRMNDIYAFSVGIYILGGVSYILLNHRPIVTYIRDKLTPHTTTAAAFLRKAGTVTVRLSGVLYTYSAFAILLPALFSLLIECYLIIPLHTYLTTISSLSNQTPNPNEPSPFNSTLNATSSTLPSSTATPIPSQTRPIIHLIQSWTLGVLYIKLFARLILYSAPSRPATALRSIIRRGWTDPDVRLATRGFILPSIALMTFLLAAPLALGWLATKTVFADYAMESEQARARVYRYAYPAVLAVAVGVGGVLGTGRAFGGWRRRVRDEVYLIGERLHNFGEGRGGSKGKGEGKGKGKERERRVEGEA